MKKHLFVLISLILLLSNLAAGSTTVNELKNLPPKVSFTLVLEELPGFDVPESFWEVSYDWRIADSKEYNEKSQLQNDVVTIGDVLAKSSATLRNLKQPNNRILHVEVPVEGNLAQRLRSESQNPQVFLLRANLRIYDAKIKKTIIHFVARASDFKFFPDGKALISIKVRENGDFSVSGPVIKSVPPGYKIVNGVPRSSVPTSKNGNSKQKATSKPKKRIKTKSN